MEISIIPNKQIPTVPKLFSQTSTSSSSSGRCCCFIIHSFFPHHNSSYNSSSNLSSSFLFPPNTNTNTNKNRTTNLSFFQLSYHRRFYGDEGEDEETRQKQDYSFNEAVELFNKRDYYTCHDFLEHLWNEAQDPTRTLYHAILQCAVGFHHLFNQNHRGAMMELGEGLCKLRKMNFETGPFLQFEQEISAALEFVYQTQLELAACAEDLCLAMDQTERSYQLLGGYAAGQRLYCLGSGTNNDTCTTYIVFCPERLSDGSSDPPRVKLPTLDATEEHITVYE